MIRKKLFKMPYQELGIGEKMKKYDWCACFSIMIFGLTGSAMLYLSGKVLEDPIDILRCGIVAIISIQLFIYMTEIYLLSKVVEKYGNKKQD